MCLMRQRTLYYPRIYFSPHSKKANLRRRKFSGSASDVTTVPFFYSFFPHHQLVNLPLQLLLEFILIKRHRGEDEGVRAYRAIWREQQDECHSVTHKNILDTRTAIFFSPLVCDYLWFMLAVTGTIKYSKTTRWTFSKNQYVIRLNVALWYNY